MYFVIGKMRMISEPILVPKISEEPIRITEVLPDKQRDVDYLIAVTESLYEKAGFPKCGDEVSYTRNGEDFVLERIGKRNVKILLGVDSLMKFRNVK